MSENHCDVSECDSTVDAIAAVASVLIIVVAAVFWVATR
jgi:hypothetical protein